MQAAQSTETWQRMWAVYHDALERPAGERTDFVRAAAGTDASLQTEVLSLLDSHDRAGEAFLHPPRVIVSEQPEPPEAPLTGRRIGRYLVGPMLAEGGSAVVYEAQQFDPPKAVALKVVRQGMADRRSLRRFEYEAEILARLQHPAIAQVFEAGSFDVGVGAQPYFAMELVRGERLTDFAAARHLEPADRVRLMIEACEAVHHAHLRGVIHRDLKPSNILVETGDGTSPPRVKVLDFGVAQLTEGDSSATRATVFSEVAGTLAYMSPEQAGGDSAAIGPRSDVYALGVLAYEMLGGRLPLMFESSSLFDAIRVIRDREPDRLGTLDSRLRGDLELIVHKAISKEISLRYESAADLAADLRRWLNREPITARPATRWYRLKKFSQRNKPLVAGVILAALAMVAGTLIATNQAVQALRAERLASKRAENAQVLAASVLEKLQSAIASLPQTTAMRADLIRESIQFLDDVSNEFAGDADILLIAGRAHTQLGRAMGSLRGASLNDVPGSIREYERAIETLAMARRLEPNRADIAREEGYARMGLTDALRAERRIPEAIDQGLRSAANFRAIINGRASLDSLECVGMYRHTADAATAGGEVRIADEALAESRMVLQSLREPPADEIEEQLWLARTMAELGRQLLEAGSPESIAMFNGAETIIARAAERGANATTARLFLIDAVRSKYDAHFAADQMPEALIAAQQCSRLCREHLADGANNQPIRQILHESLRRESEAQLRLGDFASAIALAHASLDEAIVMRQLEPTAGPLRGREWLGRVWLLMTLVSSAESVDGGSPLRQAWIAEALEQLATIDRLARESAESETALMGSPEAQNLWMEQLGSARSRLAALTR